MIIQSTLEVATSGRGMINIIAELVNAIAKSGITTGLCNVFIHHTSASLIISENHDPLVQSDMEAFIHRLVHDGDSLFQHNEEGPDDMSSHVRTALTQTFLTIPITDKRLALGTWQGVFLWEHRFQPHQRRLTVTLIG